MKEILGEFKHFSDSSTLKMKISTKFPLLIFQYVERKSVNFTVFFLYYFIDKNFR